MRRWRAKQYATSEAHEIYRKKQRAYQQKWRRSRNAKFLINKTRHFERFLAGSPKIAPGLSFVENTGERVATPIHKKGNETTEMDTTMLELEIFKRVARRRSLSSSSPSLEQSPELPSSQTA